MKSRVTLQPVFVLHTRPFRDTSLLIDALTVEHGRISLLARGVRHPRAHLRSILQPFIPLLMSWYGAGELLTMTKVEAINLPYHLTAKALISGFYLNELIMRLLHRYDPHPNVYHIYQKTLLRLHENRSIEIALRLFEKTLLSELGYGLQLKVVQGISSEIIVDKWYKFIPGYGLTQCSHSSGEQVFSGKSLLALLANVFDDAEVLQDIKRLMRIALQALLGNKVLKSRELFI